VTDTERDSKYAFQRAVAGCKMAESVREELGITDIAVIFNENKEK
jgi:hypothetical protein